MYRNLITKYTGTCADCGAELPTGSKARYYGRGRLYGVDCHEDTAKTTTAPPILAALIEAAAAAGSAYVNYVAEFYTAPAFEVVENAPGDMFHNPAAPTRTVGTMFDPAHTAGVGCAVAVKKLHGSVPRLLIET